MSKGFQQPTPGRREAEQVELTKESGSYVELDFCDGCGTRFRPSPLNAPGACSRCALGSVYATRYES